MTRLSLADRVHERDLATQIPRVKALDPIRSAAIKVERYLDNVLRSPSLGHFNARKAVFDGAYPDLMTSIAELESRMHTGWDYIDTLPDGDEKERSTDRLLQWITGYEAANDLARKAIEQIDLTHDRLSR